MSGFDHQLLVVGAGPAGMAAAQSAASHGVRVTVIDEQPNPGGQIYRNVDASPLADIGLLGRDYRYGEKLVKGFRSAPVDYRANSALWYLDRSGEIGIVEDGVHRSARAQCIVIACGAQERPMPFPGWDKPGVMTAGAGQILMKSAGLVPGEAPVLAGSGPLLLLLAWQYLRAGLGIRALVDTSPRGIRWSAIPKLPSAIAAGDYLYKGMQLVAAIRRARVPWYRGATDLQAHGGQRLDAVSFASAGKQHRIQTPLLMLHQGVIPAVQLPLAAGCETEWNEQQQCWRPCVDDWGESSQTGIFIAGDAAGIGGARAAWLSGQLAGLQVARQLRKLEASQRDRLAKRIRVARARQLAIRPFLDQYYRIPETALAPTDATLACRCEEVAAAEIRGLASAGCSGPNQAKAFTRCGMGPCQGRFCGSSVEAIFSDETGTGRQQVGCYTARSPLKPITLGQLASKENQNE